MEIFWKMYFFYKPGHHFFHPLWPVRWRGFSNKGKQSHEGIYAKIGERAIEKRGSEKYFASLGLSCILKRWRNSDKKCKKLEIHDFERK